MSETPNGKIPMVDFSVWCVQQQSYTLDYYYVITPTHVRWLERFAHWLADHADALLAWCESRKKRVTWPNGEWGNDVG